MARFTYTLPLFIAVLMLAVVVSNSPDPVGAGTGTAYTCRPLPGKKVFTAVKNEGGHPEYWEDVPTITKTLGPIQQDGSRSVRISITTLADGEQIIETAENGFGIFSGTRTIQYAGYTTTVKFRGRDWYNPDDPHPAKETGGFIVGADGSLPGGKPIVYYERCLPDNPNPVDVDIDSDGVSNTVKFDSPVTTMGMYHLNPVPQNYHVTTHAQTTMDIPATGSPALNINANRLYNGQWAAYRGNSIEAVYTGQLDQAGTTFTFNLPQELGGDSVTVPVEGDVSWYLELNDKADLLLFNEVKFDLSGNSFEFLNGSAETGAWTWRTDAINASGSLDHTTGDFSLTVEATFDAEYLRATESDPLTFQATISGNLGVIKDRAEVVDNCPSVPNPDQADADADGVGDVCDFDFTDFDCDGDTDLNDALKQFAAKAGLTVDQETNCPPPGTNTTFANYNVIWGDISCNGIWDAQDGLLTVRLLAHLPVAQEPDCPPLPVLS